MTKFVRFSMNRSKEQKKVGKQIYFKGNKAEKIAIINTVSKKYSFTVDLKNLPCKQLCRIPNVKYKKVIINSEECHTGKGKNDNRNVNSTNNITVKKVYLNIDLLMKASKLIDHKEIKTRGK